MSVSQSAANGRRDRILTTASELFSRQEFGSVLMDDIAADANVAKGTLYNYFGSKDALYGEVITSRLESLVSALRDSSSQRDDVRVNVRRLAVHVMSFMLKYPAFFRLWKREEGWICGDGQHPWCRLRTELHSVLVDIVRSGIDAGHLRAVDPAVAAALVFGAIDGAVYRNIGGTVSDAEIRRERDDLDEFVWRALRAGVET